MGYRLGVGNRGRQNNCGSEELGCGRLGSEGAYLDVLLELGSCGATHLPRDCSSHFLYFVSSEVSFTAAPVQQCLVVELEAGILCGTAWRICGASRWLELDVSS